MARGKYAARAANARAGVAQESAAALKAQLATERLEHQRAVAELEATITSLRRAISQEAAALATEDVERVRAEADKSVKQLLGKVQQEREAFQGLQEQHAAMFKKAPVLLRALGYSHNESMEILLMLAGEKAQRTVVDRNDPAAKLAVGKVRALQRARGERGADQDLEAIRHALFVGDTDEDPS